MPLSEQERRCIDLALKHLGSQYGGSWCIERYLDDEFPSENTPEVLVTNGECNAAIEVKRLTDPETQELIESLRSNERYFTPPCGGYYWMATPPDLEHRIDRQLRRHLKKEIERVAPTLNVQESGALRVSRSARLECVNTKPNTHHLSCYHLGPISDLLRPLSSRVNGIFFLDDRGLEHSFVTEEGRNAFYDIIAAACQMCPEGKSVSVEWHEEWRLTKTRERESGKQDGVWVIAASDAFDVAEASRTSVKNILDKASPKFESKNWANLHVLVVDWTASMLDPVLDIVRNLQPNELEPIDLVLIVKDDQIVGNSPIRGS